LYRRRPGDWTTSSTPSPPTTPSPTAAAAPVPPPPPAAPTPPLPGDEEPLWVRQIGLQRDATDASGPPSLGNFQKSMTKDAV